MERQSICDAIIRQWQLYIVAGKQSISTVSTGKKHQGPFGRGTE